MMKYFFLLALFCTLTIGSGQTLNWGYKLGTFTSPEITDAAQFSNGDMLLVGYFSDSLQLDTTSVPITTSGSFQNGFLARIDTNGILIWVKVIEGFRSYVLSVAISPNDTVFIAGIFQNNIDLDPSASTAFYHTLITPDYDHFLGKYDPNGDFISGGHIRNSGPFGSTVDNPSIATEGSNQVILSFSSKPIDNIDLDLGPDSLWINTAAHAFNSVYVVSYNFDLTLKWHKVIHGASTGFLSFSDLSITADGNIHILGYNYGNIEASSSHNGPEYTATNYITPKNFWLSLAPSGNFQWLHILGETTGNGIIALKLREVNDAVSGACFLFGSLNGPVDLDRTSSTYLLSPAAASNDFVAKFDKNGLVQWGFLPDPQISISGLAVNTDNVTLSGRFSGAADFNHGARDSILNSSNPNGQGFLATYDSQGQFLSVFKMPSMGHYFTEKVFSLPKSSSLITIIKGLSTVSTIDLDISNTVTHNVVLPPGHRAIASYTLPCKTALAIDRDTLPDSFDLCVNNDIDLYFPRRASGYSQMVWEADTGVGFINLDSTKFTYQIKDDNLRIFSKEKSDTIFIRGIISNSCGMDTTEIVSLYIRKADLDSLHYILCKQDTVTINGVNYFQSITFTDSLQNGVGCDSVLIHVVEQVYPNAYIIQNGVGLETAPQADSYQWLRCHALQPVPGATDSIFYPSDTGEYSVVVTISGCSDTSQCMKSSIGLNESFIEEIECYPNPTSGNITLQRTSGGEPLQCRLVDLRGKLLSSFALEGKQTNLKLNSFPSGSFLLEIRNQKGLLVQQEKIIITK